MGGRLHYTPEELRAIRQHLDPDYQGAVESMLALGLRRHEVIAVQVQDVDLLASVYGVKQRDGAWRVEPMPPGYSGVVQVRRGKGGRPREVPVPGWYHRELAELVVAAAASDGRLWPVQARALHRAVWSACRQAGLPSRGVHGLRHSWVRTNYEYLCALGRSDNTARQEVSWWSGHNRVGVTLAYIPSPGTFSAAGRSTRNAAVLPPGSGV